MTAATFSGSRPALMYSTASLKTGRLSLARPLASRTLAPVWLKLLKRLGSSRRTRAASTAVPESSAMFFLAATRRM